MEELSTFKDYGWQGVLILVAAPWARMAYKKWVTGDWTSYGDLKKENEANRSQSDANRADINRIMDELRRIDKIQSEREAKKVIEEVRSSKLEKEQEYVKDYMIEMKETTRDIFALIKDLKDNTNDSISEIKTILIQMK